MQPNYQHRIKRKYSGYSFVTKRMDIINMVKSTRSKEKEEELQAEIKRLKLRIAKEEKRNNALSEAIKDLKQENSQLNKKALGADKNKEQFNLLAKNILDIIWVFNFTQNKFTFISPSVYHALGFTVEEALKFSFSKTLSEDSKNKLKELIPIRLERFINGISEVFKDEFQEVHKDGTLRWVEIVTSLRYGDDGSIEVHGVTRDISSIKKAETELTKLSAAVEQSPLVIAITDLNGNLEYINPKFTELTGYTAEEAIGNSLAILKSGKQPDGSYTKLWKTISAGKTWHGEFYNKKKNGELFWESASISAVFDKQNNIVNYIKIAEDITERKAIEEKLQTALEKAQESDKLKSAFLANMSHEIRTPVHGILGFVSLLGNPELDNDKKLQYINIIKRNGDRLLSTINDLIDISKIRAGQMKIIKTETAINKLMLDLYDFFKPEAENKGLKLKVIIPESKDDLTIITDNTKLYNTLTNLIKNAIKYTEKGKITFGYKFQDNYIEFYVSDTGIGIPKERQQAVFNRFEQADIEDKKAKEGSGLGLSISRAYIEMLGGNMLLKSDEGKGSTFKFTIPFIEAKPAETISDTGQKCEPPVSIGSESCTLLVAEDEETSSLFLKIILRDKFKEILFAKNGIEAVEILKKHPEIRIILMDLKMPEMDGYEATKKIREFNNDVIIVAQTAHALARDKRKALESGFNDFVTKPINKEQLLIKICQIIEGKNKCDLNI